MSRWKSSLLWLLLGVGACGGAQPSPAHARSVPWIHSSFDHCASTMAQENTMDEKVSRAEQFMQAFDAAWSRNDVDGAVALFARDATLESPLIQRLLHREEGILRGREEIAEMVRVLMRGGKAWGGHEPPLIRGNTIAIEFKPPSSEAEHYSVDIIELRDDGKIQSLRAYLGWRPLSAGKSEGRP